MKRSLGRGERRRLEAREREVRLWRSLRERGERASSRGRAERERVVRDGRWARAEGSRRRIMLPERERERREGRASEGGGGWMSLL